MGRGGTRQGGEILDGAEREGRQMKNEPTPTENCLGMGRLEHDVSLLRQGRRRVCVRTARSRYMT